ncbi:FxsA family protein [Mycobacterium sp. M1]|uniref:FxsA family protein n=1 Tax=Mycolicibacter acidiphilus TaxID=2835306 RepID=A0ABS5RLH4_9MYCO|nr:FxsA family protein [Mycolicibacter acidiphilus]MBS9535019.1 FxsA family protein [Mycolicibacter acidiphilus]
MVSAALRVFLAYLLIEVAATAALVWLIGFGWTVLALLGTFAVGLALAGSQARRQVGRLRRGGPRQGALADGALVLLGTGLVVVPGLVSTVAGLLLLTPATRSAARPALVALAVAGLGRHTPLVAAVTVGRQWYEARRPAQPGDFIDAEFVDVTDTPSAALSAGALRGPATP